MAELKKGDVVQLKSSNTPKMNIESLGDFSPSGPSDGACCVCIDKNQKCSAVFDVACLVQIPDEKDLDELLDSATHPKSSDDSED